MMRPLRFIPEFATVTHGKLARTPISLKLTILSHAWSVVNVAIAQTLARSTGNPKAQEYGLRQLDNRARDQYDDQRFLRREQER